MLSELPFYEKMSVIKTNHRSEEYAKSFKIKTIGRKDPIYQLKVSKSSIKDLFSDVLNEPKDLSTI